MSCIAVPLYIYLKCILKIDLPAVTWSYVEDAKRYHRRREFEESFRAFVFGRPNTVCITCYKIVNYPELSSKAAKLVLIGIGKKRKLDGFTRYISFYPTKLETDGSTLTNRGNVFDVVNIAYVS